MTWDERIESIQTCPTSSQEDFSISRFYLARRIDAYDTRVAFP